MKEEAVQFGDSRSLVGIVANGSLEHPAKPAVILLNPGIVHRVGPGRIYVKIARALASQGFASLRFDFSGIGDSTVRMDNRCFEQSSVDEACAAMNFLQTTKRINRFILLGGCSGAVVSLETCRIDRRAIGAILINFPARADEEAQMNQRSDAHYYWHRALLSLRSWRKLLTGHSDYRKVGRALWHGAKRKFGSHSTVSASDQRFQAALREVAGRDVELTFICSKGDSLLPDLREAGGNELKKLCAQGKVACEIIPKSDHTFSSLYDQERLVEVILKRAEAAAMISKQQVQIPAVTSNSLGTLFQRSRSIS